jgi:ABC-type dipeptide/oligopeptide/nickel transport system permease subunit
MVGLILVALVLGIALFGPFFSPDSPSYSSGVPFAKPSGSHPFGLDYLGRDVLSRFLWGGRSVLEVALVATIVGCVVGVFTGLLCAYRRGALDGAVMRFTDVLLSFPGLLLTLVIVTTAGDTVTVILLAVALHTGVRMIRVARAAALEVTVQPYVEAAEARGDPVSRIVLFELLPNIRTPILVEAGVRFVYAIIAVASLSFLGLGIQPPRADWGLMIAENRRGLTLTAWPVIPPLVALATLTIGVNLLGDAYSRASARSLRRRDIVL